MHKFHDVWKSEFLWLVYDSSNNVMYCDVCRKAGPDITSKTKFVTGKKKIKRESEHEKCFSMVSAKAHSSIKHLLSQGINNYPQINTYWSCVVHIGIFINLASNMFLLMSKKCFLTSQG